MAIPTAASIFILASAWTSSMVVMPPAAVMGKLGRLPQPAEPAQAGPLHHSFLVHIGAQEPGAVGLQRRDHILGTQARCACAIPAPRSAPRLVSSATIRSFLPTALLAAERKLRSISPPGTPRSR